MRALKYFVTEAAASLWRGRRSSALAIFTIAAGLFVLGFFLIVNTNMRRLTARWAASAEFAVFLRDDATRVQLETVQALISSSGLAASQEYVSKEQAAQRFSQDFPDLAAASRRMERNPFPASFDVRLRSDLRSAEAEMEGLARTLAAQPGVSDVRDRKSTRLNSSH